MKIRNIIFALAIAAPALVSCNKFLDVDPSKSTQKTLETAEQLDAILGSYSRFYSEYNHTALACDDFGISPEIEDGGASFSPVSELAFILCDTRCTQTARLLWDGEYSKIYYANLVLSNIDDVSGDQAYKDNLKAEAHFLRAYSMFQLALAYTLYYDGTNGDEPGLPLKQTTSFEESVARANLADTWSFIESDLQAALSGITVPLVSGGKRRVWRGTTAAVHAFAARYYLYRGDYANALAQVEAVLEETSTLKDYNDPAQMSYFPRPDEYEINATTGTKETVEVYYPYTCLQFYGSNGFPELFEWEELLFARTCSYASWWYIPSEGLMDNYAVDLSEEIPTEVKEELEDGQKYDTRKNDRRFEFYICEDFSLRYCNHDPAFRYPGYCQFYYDNIISGPTVSEMLLIKAEIQARQGQFTEAMETLRPLRAARIRTDVDDSRFFNVSSQQEAVTKILQERRRELAFTMRWYDIKRLNANEDTSDDVTIVKTFYPYNTSTVLSSEAPIEYRIEPGSRKFATPIPDVEITRSEGVIQQNTY